MNCFNVTRGKNPLVHHITNYVTVNDCANVCICAHGSPVMTDEADDIPQMTKIASSLVLNIGTLNNRTVESMIIAGKVANDSKIPIVFDPVGVGATSYRTDVASRIIGECRPSVIKGNAGEIGVLSGIGGDVKGVDSNGINGDLSEAVRMLSNKYGCIVAASGPVDYVSDGDVTYELGNGSDYQGLVSGTGCMLSSVIGCYVGACGASIDSVVSAITVFNIAAESAERNAKGPASFKVSLMDALYSLKTDDIEKMAKVRIL